jgi:hypothetical protein
MSNASGGAKASGTPQCLDAGKPNANAGTRFMCVTDLKPDEAPDPDLIDAAVESIKEAFRSYPVRRPCRPPPVRAQELHP